MVDTEKLWTRNNRGFYVCLTRGLSIATIRKYNLNPDDLISTLEKHDFTSMYTDDGLVYMHPQFYQGGDELASIMNLVPTSSTENKFVLHITRTAHTIDKLLRENHHIHRELADIKQNAQKSTPLPSIDLSLDSMDNQLSMDITWNFSDDERDLGCIDTYFYRNEDCSRVKIGVGDDDNLFS